MNKYIAGFITFNYINFTFIFFRSESLDNSINIIKGMIGFNGFDFVSFSEGKIYIILILLVSIVITFFFKNTNYLIENFKTFKVKEN